MGWAAPGNAAKEKRIIVSFYQIILQCCVEDCGAGTEFQCRRSGVRTQSWADYSVMLYRDTGYLSVKDREMEEEQEQAEADSRAASACEV